MEIILNYYFLQKLNCPFFYGPIFFILSFISYYSILINDYLKIELKYIVSIKAILFSLEKKNKIYYLFIFKK
jgi:hypothetical protein